MVYPHEWSPISYRSSAGQRKQTGQRPMFYCWTTQPACYVIVRIVCYVSSFLLVSMQWITHCVKYVTLVKLCSYLQQLCEKLLCCVVCSPKLFELCFVVHCFHNISCFSDSKKCGLLDSEKAACSALYSSVCSRCWSKLSCCQSVSVHNCNQCSGITDLLSSFI